MEHVHSWLQFYHFKMIEYRSTISLKEVRKELKSNLSFAFISPVHIQEMMTVN